MSDGTGNPVDTVIALWDEIDENGGRRAHEFFTEDGAVTFDEYSVRGRAAIEELYRVRRSGTDRVSRHVVTNLRLHRAEPAKARVKSTLVLFAGNGKLPLPELVPQLVADVEDLLEEQEGRWLLRERRISHVFIAPETVLGVPVR